MSKVDEAFEALKKSLGVGAETPEQKIARQTAEAKQATEAAEKALTDAKAAQAALETPPATPPATHVHADNTFDQAQLDIKLKEQKEALEAEFTEKLKGVTSKGTPPPATPPATPPEQKEGVNMKDWNERLTKIKKSNGVAV